MKEEQLFHEALEKPAEQRDAYIDAVCGEDADLRQRVEMLLRAHANPGNFLEQPAVHSDDTRDLSDYIGEVPVGDPVIEQAGTIIGPYRICEQIGEGGMSVVFAAEQTHPIRRTVALKIIKPGMDSRQVIARFEVERQAIGMMDHPNIARVLDAGTTGDRRPFFAMELVSGVRLTRFCDDRQLSIRERLQLFIDVCHGVQHAHQKGIIHRDLKPGNLLVAMQDGKPVVKIIDFGIAKALNQQLSDHSLHTNFSQVIGTPVYMSPEQSEPGRQDIDTRSDIYSLGVVLYEILTGSTPFDRKMLHKLGINELQRMVEGAAPPQ